MKFKTFYIKLKLPTFNIVAVSVDWIKIISIVFWRGFKFSLKYLLGVIRFPVLYVLYMVAHIFIGGEYCYDLLFMVKFKKMTSKKFIEKYRVRLI